MEQIRLNRQKVREYLDRRGLDAVMMTKRSNYAWYTGGSDNHIVLATEEGESTLIVTRDKDYCVCTNIEAPRIIAEELSGSDIEVRSYPWHESPDALIRELVRGGRCASDVGGDYESLDSDFARLRFALSEGEMARMRELGAVSGTLLEETCRNIRQGDTEHRVAGALFGRFVSRGIQLPVALVAFDERIRRFRHPIPTSKVVEEYAMVVIMAELHGLMVAATRLVHFGRPPEDLRRRMRSTAQIDATMIAHTRPGERVSDILARGIEEYARQGYADEWRLHHQGGPCGYWTREYLATPSVEDRVALNQAFAWNPSITGTKCEDTCIAGQDETEIITATGDWPTIDVRIGDTTYHRPDILVI